MTFTHREEFHVRYNECDQYGHVNNAVYLSYLDETRLRAAEAVGYGLQQLTAQNLRFWTARTEIEYLAPLYESDSVEVLCSVIDLSGATLWHEYELHKTANGEMIAKGITGTNLINYSGEPIIQFPDKMASAFFPDGKPEGKAPLEPFLSAPPFPPGVFRIRKKVEWQDVNATGQVDLPMLLMYVEDCGRQVVAAHGWAMERMLDQHFAILLRRNQVEYSDPICLDDEIELLTWASDVRRVTATRHYVINRLSNGDNLACVHALGVWVNLVSGLPMRIPPDLLSDFASNIIP
jgi:acyl-CoA thioester hydrolase